LFSLTKADIDEQSEEEDPAYIADETDEDDLYKVKSKG